MKETVEEPDDYTENDDYAVAIPEIQERWTIVELGAIVRMVAQYFNSSSCLRPCW